MKETVKRNQATLMKQQLEVDELHGMNEDLQERLGRAIAENEQLRQDLERERQVDMLPERAQVAALKDENERLHRESEMLGARQTDKHTLLENELE